MVTILQSSCQHRKVGQDENYIKLQWHKQTLIHKLIYSKTFSLTADIKFCLNHPAARTAACTVFCFMKTNTAFLSLTPYLSCQT